MPASTAYPRFRLEAPGLEPLEIDCGPIGGSRFDLGDAVIREDVINAPNADGTVDNSQLLGARVVTLEVLVDSPSVADSRWRLTSRLRAFTHPRLRPLLFVQFSATDPELMVILRRSQFSDVWGPNDAGRGRVTLQWVAPSGLIESAVLHEAVVRASAVPDLLGRTYDLTFDRVYPASDPEGSVLVVNEGNMDVYPLIRLYGPWSGETSVINDLTDQAVVINGESVSQGDYIELDFRPGARTVLYNSNPDDSRHDSIIYPDTSWWALYPGEQRIRFVSTSFTVPAEAVISWRDAFL